MVKRIAIFGLFSAALGCSGSTPPTPSPPSAPTPAAAPEQTAAADEPRAFPRLAAIDAYGSSRATNHAIVAAQRDAIRQTWGTADPGERRARKDAVVAAIHRMGDFAFVELSAILYFEDEGQVGYLTIDLVDAADAARRIPFRPSPTATMPDPEGVAAAWRKYQTAVFELMSSGDLKPQRTHCPAWHCLGDYEHPSLEPLITPVRAGAEPNKDALAAVLFDHRDPELRAAAAFALAHVVDGDQVASWMLQAMWDPASEVRNNAMRVLVDIAHHSHVIDIPIEPMIGALDFPTTTDRNKALAVVDGLLERPRGSEYAAAIRGQADALKVLLALLRLKQPNNHDFAHEILRTISGKSHGARDFAAWEQWVTETRTE